MLCLSLPLPAEPFPTLLGRLKLAQPCGPREQAPTTSHLSSSGLSRGCTRFSSLAGLWGGGGPGSHPLGGLPHISSFSSPCAVVTGKVTVLQMRKQTQTGVTSQGLSQGAVV